jgi:hypothetical protein
MSMTIAFNTSLSIAGQMHTTAEHVTGLQQVNKEKRPKTDLCAIETGYRFSVHFNQQNLLKFENITQ